MMKLKLLSCLMLFIISLNVHASKFDLQIGTFSYNGQANGENVSVSGLGAYEAALLYPFLSNYELNIGYSLTMTSIVGGDFSYGPKMGVNFFPFNYSGSSKISYPKKTIIMQDLYKPYIGVSFNQRQFQSAKTNFAGFGLSAGSELLIFHKYNTKVEIKYNNYTGSNNSKATEVNLMFGFVFDIN